jgi:hypothetical protein
MKGFSSIHDRIDIPVPANPEIKGFERRFAVDKIAQEYPIDLDIPFVIEFIKGKIISGV